MKRLFISLFLMSTFLYGGDKLSVQDVIKENDLALRGSGTFKVALFIKVFDMSLYTKERTAEELFSGAEDEIVIELRYHQNISAERLTDKGDSILQDIYGEEFIRKHASKLKHMNSFYKAVKKGDRYALHYTSGGPLILFLNDKHVITFEQSEFNRQYIDIWLGQHKSTRKLRSQILEGDL